ncbi:hypothetical protein F4818DRAFT_446061 [Hypoxylon cercidicola]|nr:hypothetical protein F4818DRAFT_446061 [Hypoxylon cercidicola]
MSSVTPSSMASSSPISFPHDPLTLELQPPPLRLPQRKIDATFDGSASVHQKQISGISDDPFTSTTNPGRSSPSPQPATTKILSQNRTAPRLDSLVSKFEILDAVNSVEISPSFKPRINAIPRVQGVLIRPNGPTESSQQVPFSEADKHNAARNSSDFSPRQVASPPPSSTKSRLPASTPLKAKVDEDNADTIHRAENTEGASAEGITHPPTSRISPIRRLEDDDPETDPRHSTTSRAGRRPDRHVAKQSPVKGHGPPTLPERSVNREQPSVADLRRSFEQKSQPPGWVSKASSKSKPPSKKTTSYFTRNKEIPLSSDPIYGGRTPFRTTQKKNTNIETPPSAARITQTKPGTKSEQSLAASYMTNQLYHTPTVSLPKSSRFREKGAQRGVPNLDGNLSSEPIDTEYEEQLREGAFRTSLIHPGWSLNWKFSSRNAPASERPMTRGPRVREEAQSTPSPGLKSGPSIGFTGKVSDLRKLFERSATPGISPNSIKSFWRNRGWTKPEPAMEMIPATGSGPADSSTTLDEHITPLKRIPVPELTTEISTDDFLCDFAGTPDSLRPMTPGSYLETAADNDALEELESPVKNHIQRFEQLEHDSPAESLAPDNRTKSSDDGLHPSIRGKENKAREIKPQASWHPFRQRSVRLWRRISNSFSRSADRNSSGDDSEQDSSSTYVDTNSTRRGSVCQRPRYRRQNLFGYHLHRTSELVRSSVELSQRDSRLSINDELMERFENRPPYLTYTGSISNRLSIRRTFPFLARMSDGLECADEFDGFGLDGSLVSKASRCRDKSPTGEVSQTTRPVLSESTARADPNPLSKVVSRQTIAERKLRRIEEKQLRKEQREKKREKARGTDQEEGRSNDCNGEGNHGADENAEKKGKGKEVAGKEKKESSWSKKTASGFVVRQVSDVMLKHPKPRRPGQVKKIVNMYKEKASSGLKFSKGSGVGSASGSAAAKSETTDKR